ncbi:MAG: glycoside hydrolase [Thiohalomonadaceae bacterium]
MSDDGRLPVILCWHMHQPYYQDREGGYYQLPWTYLHAIKDYVDMAAIIEEVPDARAVVNFAPILLEQIDDYARQVRGFLNEGTVIRDHMLAALVMPALPTDPERRATLMKSCLRANRKRLIERFPNYRVLAELADCIGDHIQAVLYFDEQFLVDLVVWYHLAWLGETVRKDSRVQALIAKGQAYTQHDRRLLLEVIGELLEGVLPRYRRLAEAGRIELSVTPYAHPILPLLIDIQSAREAMPEVTLPLISEYPGGTERARWHVEEGLRVFESYFGFRPKGCWPAEGSVSTPALKLLGEAGFAWAATGGGVLRNSLHKSGLDGQQCIHRAYRATGTGIECFFRDDGLSDLIGFTYADWHADDAVSNLVHHLENIAGACADQQGRVVSIILDGENAWEYYPQNGYHFLTALYRRLASHPKLRLTTFSDFLASQPPVTELPTLVAGSWVYGTFSTWIGDCDKNRGWDLLGEVKRAFDEAVASGSLTGERLARAERHLAICEGSDWFWWFGDYNPSESVRDFERLYRMHLADLYRLLGRESPDSLTRPISQGGGRPQMGGVMRRGQES